MRKGQLIEAIKERQCGGELRAAGQHEQPPAEGDRPPRRQRRRARPRRGTDSAPRPQASAPQHGTAGLEQPAERSSDGPRAAGAATERVAASDRQQGDRSRATAAAGDRQQRQRPAAAGRPPAGQSDRQPAGRPAAAGRPRSQGDRDRDDDDFDGGGRSRRRGRYRDRNRSRGRGRDGVHPPTRPSPRSSEDDVLVPVAGILDILDNYAFVRTSGYLPGPNDVYVSLAQVRKSGLRKGDAITGVGQGTRARASARRSSTRWSVSTPSTAPSRRSRATGSSSTS